MVEIGDEARDALAGTPDQRLPEFAARWMRIEEWQPGVEWHTAEPFHDSE